MNEYISVNSNYQFTLLTTNIFMIIYLSGKIIFRMWNSPFYVELAFILKEMFIAKNQNPSSVKGIRFFPESLLLVGPSRSGDRTD